MSASFEEYFNLEEIPEEKLSKCPWRAEFLKNLESVVKKHATIWSEIVYCTDRNEEENKKFKTIFIDEIESTLHGLIINARTLYDKHLEIMTKNMEKIDTLSTALDVPVKTVEMQDGDISLVELTNFHLEKIVKLEEDLSNKTENQVNSLTSAEDLIESYKKDLQRLWDKCRCDGKTRNEFGYIYTTTYNYETLRIFEKEILKWQNYYEEHKEILNAVTIFERLLEDINELELNTNQEKVYKNRNCQLSIELRKKNILNSRLKAVEEKLTKQYHQYLRDEPSLCDSLKISNLLENGSKKKKFLAAAFPINKPLRKSPKIRTPKPGVNKPTPKNSNQKRRKSVSKQGLKSTGTAEKGTPPLPRFKINETRKSIPNKKLQWKPLNVQNDEESWTDYSDFEKNVETVPRSSAINKEKN